MNKVILSDLGENVWQIEAQKMTTIFLNIQRQYGIYTDIYKTFK